MSAFYYEIDGVVIERALPEPDVEVLSGIPWGSPETPFTPAYWLTQYWMREPTSNVNHQIGCSLQEEVIACLLGGYGLPAEVGIAAFQRLKDRQLVQVGMVNAEQIALALREPLEIDGRRIQYRFWRQKAKYVSGALEVLAKEDPPLTDSRALRKYLLQIPGIGPKTASWIVRNWNASDDVAILDIHVVRAGKCIGLYNQRDRVGTEYFRMERKFLEFARAIGVPASRLDELIWAHMRPSNAFRNEQLNLFREISHGRSKQLRLPH